MERLKLAQAIVVEGKYDKIKLGSVVDAVILPTCGYRIFKDPEKLALLRFYATTTGLIILTDSDSAGFRIRGFLKGALPPESRVTHVYIPDVFGKERRKRNPSAEGKLGVEGMDGDVLRAAFEAAGVTADVRAENPDPVTHYDFYALGLSGRENSSLRRAALLRRLKLPELLSVGALLEVVNTLLTRDELYRMMEQTED